jgi:hypothetical protein
VAILVRPGVLTYTPRWRVVGQMTPTAVILLLMVFAPHWSAIAGPRFDEADDPVLREARERTTTTLIGSLEQLRTRLGVPTADLDTTAECRDGRDSAGFGARNFNNICTVRVSLPFAVQVSFTEFAARMNVALLADGWRPGQMPESSLAAVGKTPDPARTFIYFQPSRTRGQLEIQFRDDNQLPARLNSDTGLAAIVTTSAIFYED